MILLACAGSETTSDATSTLIETTTSDTTGTTTTTAGDPLLQQVLALSNPYNVALFIHEDPLHYVNVNFELAGADDGVLSWYPQDDPDAIVTVAAVRKATVFGTRTVYGYGATMGPFEPGTTYLYRVGNAAGTALDVWREYVAPVAAPPAATFAVFADPQENDELGYMAYAYDYLGVLAQDGRSLDFTMFVGDIVNDYEIRGQWNWFFRYSAGFCLRTPIAATIGNHEHDAVSGDRMKALEYDAYTNLPQNGPTYGAFTTIAGDQRGPDIDRGKTYSFNFGPAHFVAIDTEIFCDGTTACLTYDEQAVASLVGWLEDDLATAAGRWIIVYLHRGPYASSYDTEAVRDHLVPVFEANGVALVLSGHDHKYSRSIYLAGNPVGFRRADAYLHGTVSLLDDPEGPDFNAYAATTGVTYLVGNSSGTKFYGASPASGITVQYAFDDDDPVIPIVTVTATSITVTSYVLLKRSPVDIVSTAIEVLETFRITR